MADLNLQMSPSSTRSSHALNGSATLRAFLSVPSSQPMMRFSQRIVSALSMIRNICVSCSDWVTRTERKERYMRSSRRCWTKWESNWCTMTMKMRTMPLKLRLESMRRFLEIWAIGLSSVSLARNVDDQRGGGLRSIPCMTLRWRLRSGVRDQARDLLFQGYKLANLLSQRCNRLPPGRRKERDLSSQHPQFAVLLTRGIG